jgi:DNA replication protein DnaC
VERLAQLSWISEAANVCFLGPPGTGKSHLAIALSIRACQAGHRVALATAADWVARLEAAQERDSLEAELRRLERYGVLVVDEVGYLPLERQAANLLFALVARRYERGSIIVTSNRSFEQWGEILGDAMVAAALIDRFVHHATMIGLKGKSYRLRERGSRRRARRPDPGLTAAAPLAADERGLRARRRATPALLGECRGPAGVVHFSVADPGALFRWPLTGSS